MKPEGLTSKIFLDGGDPEETRDIKDLLGFLDGQTTNPTLISKNPEAHKRLDRGEKFSGQEIIDFYHSVVREISGILPAGSVSVEVYADPETKAGQMLSQGKMMFGWIPNAHIKFPSAPEGLKAAEQAVKDGLRVNMTLCFRQEQAAAVYAATRGAKRGDVFVSPFVGRLDDLKENGMDLIANIIRMYQRGDRHVELLTASVRTLGHLLHAIQLGSDIITAPGKTLREWAEKGLPMPNSDYIYDSVGLKTIPYKEVDLAWDWRAFDISHDLTVKGMKKFSEDWDSLILQAPAS
jgi:transaldolase